MVLIGGFVGGVVWYQRSHQDIERQADGTVLPPPVTTRIPGNPADIASCAFKQGLIQRECGILTPPDQRPDEKLPVVVLLPGIGAGPVDIRGVGDWDRAVVDRHFMLVTPQGVADSWNAGSCCGIAQATGVDDVAYLTTLIDEISKRPDVDPARVFMAGFSNGGMMTYRFACASGDRIAAMASVSGTKVISCAPKRPIPVLHIHGTGDRVVPYEGGAGIGGTLLGTSFPKVADTIDELVAQQSCTGTPVTSDEGTVHTEEWTQCAAGTRITLTKLDDWPHEWPLTTPIDATAQVLDFFGID